MPRVMYLDCFSGAAGDMLLGAMIDAGLPVEELQRALGSLSVAHALEIRRVVRAGISATHVEVIDTTAAPAASKANGPAPGHAHQHAHNHQHAHDHPHHHDHHHHHHHHGAAVEHSHGDDGHRTLKQIAHLIDHSALSSSGKARAKALFQRIGEAEAAIHGMSVDDVHLHEVGALDSIIDIVGTVFAFEWFGVDDIVASPMNVGGGTVQIAHGTYPVPAPATTRLLTGVPVYSAGPRVELVTPTGALLVSAYATTFGDLPPMRIERAGYGAGTRDFPDVPNVLRLVIGERTDANTQESVTKIECEIDDMNPQLFGPAVDRLLAAGALDVFLTPVQMKKGRPGTLVTVLAPHDRRGALSDVLFRDTTTLGIRYTTMQREVLERHWEAVTLPGGVVRIKIAARAGAVVNAMPEFEDCVNVADARGTSVKAVQAEALRAWRHQSGEV